MCKEVEGKHTNISRGLYEKYGFNFNFLATADFLDGIGDNHKTQEMSGFNIYSELDNATKEKGNNTIQAGSSTEHSQLQIPSSHVATVCMRTKMEGRLFQKCYSCPYMQMMFMNNCKAMMSPTLSAPV